MIIDRKSCSRPRAGLGAIPPAKPGKTSARAEVGNRELNSASLNESGNGQPFRSGEASIRAQARSGARAEFPGVKGVSACAKSHRELGRSAAAVAGWCSDKSGQGINNLVGRSVRKSDRPVVALKRVMTVERRGFSWEHVESEATGADWRKPRTDEAATAVESIGSRDRNWATHSSRAFEA